MDVYLAVYQNNIPFIDKLIKERGVNPNDLFPLIDYETHQDVYNYLIDMSRLYQNNLTKVKEDYISPLGETSLDLAILNNQLDVVQSLSQSDIKPKLYMAGYSGYLCMVEYLFDKYQFSQDDLNLALQMAMTRKHYDIQKFLIKNGADIHLNNDAILRYAVSDGNLSFVKYLVDLGINNINSLSDAITSAAEKGYLEIVEYLVKQGGNPLLYGGISLLLAAQNGYLEIVKYLVDLGIEIDDEVLNAAVALKRERVVAYLIEKGARVNDRSLEIVKREGYSDIEKLLRI